MPGINIYRSSVFSLTLCAFVVLKLGAPFGEAHYGQALNCPYQMRDYQHSRKFYVGSWNTVEYSGQRNTGPHRHPQPSLLVIIPSAT